MVGGWGRTFIQASLALLAPDDPVRSHQEYQGGGWGHAFAYKGGGWVGARMHIQGWWVHIHIQGWWVGGGTHAHTSCSSPASPRDGSGAAAKPVIPGRPSM